MRASRAISASALVGVVTRWKETDLPKIHARVARTALERVLSEAPAEYTQFVDGREGAPLESVKPGGLIRFKFDRIGHVLDWIYEQLVQHSPIGKPTPPHIHYFQDHQLYIDGKRFAAAVGETIDLPPNATAVIVDGRDYAAKLERGLSSQAPDGVYEIIAIAAARRFPNVKISFDYMPLPGHKYRYPSITVRAR